MTEKTVQEPSSHRSISDVRRLVALGATQEEAWRIVNERDTGDDTIRDVTPPPA